MKGLGMMVATPALASLFMIAAPARGNRIGPGVRKYEGRSHMTPPPHPRNRPSTACIRPPVGTPKTHLKALHAAKMQRKGYRT